RAGDRLQGGHLGRAPVVRGDDVPGSPGRRRPLHQVAESLAVLRELAMAPPVFLLDPPSLIRVRLALVEAPALLPFRQVHQELHDHGPAVDQGLLESADLVVGALDLLAGSEFLDALDERPTAPGAVVAGEGSATGERP